MTVLGRGTARGRRTLLLGVGFGLLAMTLFVAAAVYLTRAGGLADPQVVDIEQFESVLQSAGWFGAGGLIAAAISIYCFVTSNPKDVGGSVQKEATW